MVHKYHKIYDELLNKILSHAIQAGELLPSEHELMKQYGASRDTIRKSLNLLLQNGYIQKVAGKGSLVLDSKRIAFPVSGITSFQELKETMQGKVETQVYNLKQYPATEYLLEELHMSEGNIWEVVRIRSIQDEKVIVDTSYFNGNIVNDIPMEVAEHSLYEYFENELNLKISFSRKEITVIPATKEEQAILDMHEFNLLVCVKSYTYLEDATLFEFTLSKHRPDKFRFVDFARRMK